MSTQANSVWHVSGTTFSHQDAIRIPKSHRGPEAVLQRFLQMDLLPPSAKTSGCKQSQVGLSITDFRETSQLDFVEFSIATGSASAANSRG